MSKWLKFGINTVVVLSQIGILVAYLIFLVPIGYLVEAFNHDTAQVILNNDNFLRLSTNQQPSLAAVKSFPEWPYALIMAVGIVLLAWSSIKLLKALVKLLNNIVAQDYFSNSNELALKSIFQAQLIAFVSDCFVASGNQLTRSWLLRVNNGESPETWQNCFGDVFMLIILAAIYETYRHAMRVKTENDLTI